MLECEPLAGAPRIDGEIVLETLGTLALSRVTASAQRVRRTARQIARASEDYFLVSIQTDGVGEVHQDGRRAVLQAGDFALYDSTRPYDLVFGADFQQFVLMLPGPALRAQVRDTQALTASAVSGRRGAGHLMIEMIRTLAQDIGTLEPASAAAVADSVTQILVAGLRTLPAAQAPAGVPADGLPPGADQGLHPGPPARTRAGRGRHRRGACACHPAACTACSPARPAA